MTIEQLENLKAEYESAKDAFLFAVEDYGKKNSKFKVGEVVKHLSRKYTVTKVSCGVSAISKDLKIVYSYNIKPVAKTGQFKRNVQEYMIESIG